jgi:hypothetical protein
MRDGGFPDRAMLSVSSFCLLLIRQAPEGEGRTDDACCPAALCMGRGVSVDLLGMLHGPKIGTSRRNQCTVPFASGFSRATRDFRMPGLVETDVRGNRPCQRAGSENERTGVFEGADRVPRAWNWRRSRADDVQAGVRVCMHVE